MWLAGEQKMIKRDPTLLFHKHAAHETASTHGCLR